MKLHDAYLSVHEALKHAGIHHGCRVRVRWVDAEGMSLEEAAARARAASTACSCPGGFGSRGWEGKILACRVARERGIPYLGICLGMHVAVSEFARHVVGLDGANSTEMDPETPYPVIDLLPEQKEVEDLGGTMRLGAQAVELADGTRAREAYDEPVVHERHRHRYEVNNHYRPALVDAGLVVSGTFQEGRLVEIVELPDHPWFVASQFHPEFKSRPTRPAPLFRDFVGAALAARDRGTREPSALPRHARRPRDSKIAPMAVGGRRPLPRARRDPEPAGRGARRSPTSSRVPPRPRADGRRGRRRRRGRLDDREPLLPPRADGRRHAALPLRAPRHGAARRADRAGRRGRRRPERRRDDPRRRQQVRGRGDARGDAARARGEPAARRASSCCSRRRRRSGCSARRRSTTRGCSAQRRLRLRPGGADRRRHPRRAVLAGARGPLPRPRRALRACIPRRGARRSRPRRARSPTCGSAASTRRRPRTSG